MEAWGMEQKLRSRIAVAFLVVVAGLAVGVVLGRTSQHWYGSDNATA